MIQEGQSAIPEDAAGLIALLPRVLLASRSPRRRAFLEAAGIPHDAVHPGIDDGHLPPPDPSRVRVEHWVSALAYLKAASALEDHDRTRGGPRLILGADTTCIRGGAVLGTPRDRDDARAILSALRNGAHRVVTGVALIDTRTMTRYVACDAAEVSLGDLPDAELEGYLDSGGWAGKAGAYNLQERIAAGWPIRVRGEASTVMGLSMPVVWRLLRRCARAAGSPPPCATSGSPTRSGNTPTAWESSSRPRAF